MSEHPSSSQPEEKELKRLLSQMTEAHLSTDEHERLSALIEADTKLRDLYLDYCQMHSMLFSEQGLLASVTPPVSRQTVASSSRRRNIAAFATAATLLIASMPFAYFYWNNSPKPPQRGSAVAVVSQAAGVNFEYGVAGEMTTAIGVNMPAGKYRLKHGITELTYHSGAKLTIEAPAFFSLVDRKTVNLFEGKLSAHVPEDAIGFTVNTTRASVVDLGTDFGVDVVDQEAEVHVFTGEVRVDLRSENGRNPRPLKLVTGQATRIDRLTGLPAGINLDRQRFLGGSQYDANRPYVQHVLKLQPAVYYPMEPTNDGTLVEDISGSGAIATVFLGQTSRPIWTAGRFGAALDLRGPAHGIYAAAKWYPQTESEQLSVVAWVKARSRPRWASIVKNWAGGDDNRGQFHFGLYQDDGDLEVHIQDDSGEEVIVREGIPLPLDQWHLVSFIADGSHLRLFRNGLQVAEQPYSGLHSNPQIKALGVGTKLNLKGDAPEERNFNMWDGRIDELAIFNRALTAEEIKDLFELAQLAD